MAAKKKKSTKRKSSTSSRKNTKRKTTKRSTKKKTGRKTTKRTTKRKSSKRSTKSAPRKTKKKTAKKTTRTTPSFDDVPVFEPSEQAAPRPSIDSRISRPLAWTSLLLNVIYPGLGTLFLREYAAGIIQLLINSVGVIVIVTTREASTGLILGIIAFLWSLINSIQAISESR